MSFAHDRLRADPKTNYGARFCQGHWRVVLWNPSAKSIRLNIYYCEDRTKLLAAIDGRFKNPNWHWAVKGELEGAYYEFAIVHADGSTSMALDPYARTIGAFDWKDPVLSRPLARFVSMKKAEPWQRSKRTAGSNPIIYEASVRDLTSMRFDLANPGTYQAAVQANIGGYLKGLGFSHIQLMPVHSCAAINETNRELLAKGSGSGWETNYNWGYDPLNYFSLNGWLCVDPYSTKGRICEFKELVDHFHENGIGVILDVVYNHVFDNAFLEAVVPNYYFRPQGSLSPVKLPPLASERPMVRRLIIDSLVHFVECYGVDGFRFDLMGFTDKKTLELAAFNLRKIKKDIVLHGEAWNFTDLPLQEALVKGHTDNRLGVAYFNDTSRDAIKGRDEHGFNGGLVAGNAHFFADYLTAVVGSLRSKKIESLIPFLIPAGYERFTDDANNVLNYAACHDGHTLWDKINLSVGGTRTVKTDAYRQALMLQALLPGRLLYLQGTELFYTKPVDFSGHEWEKNHGSTELLDLYGLNSSQLAFNTFKTTDYSNGIRWKDAERIAEVGAIRSLISDLNKFRTTHPFFKLRTAAQFTEAYRFTKASEGVIDFTITVQAKSIRVVHNFTAKSYDFSFDGQLVFCSKAAGVTRPGSCPSHCSLLLKLA